MIAFFVYLRSLEHQNVCRPSNLQKGFSFWGDFVPTPTGILPLDPAGDFRPSDPPASSCFLRLISRTRPALQQGSWLHTSQFRKYFVWRGLRFL